MRFILRPVSAIWNKKINKIRKVTVTFYFAILTYRIELRDINSEFYLFFLELQVYSSQFYEIP